MIIGQKYKTVLYKRTTFKAIVTLIEKDPTTVSKEIKLHAQNHISSYVTTDEICPKLLKAPKASDFEIFIERKAGV